MYIAKYQTYMWINRFIQIQKHAKSKTRYPFEFFENNFLPNIKQVKYSTCNVHVIHLQCNHSYSLQLHRQRIGNPLNGNPLHKSDQSS